MAKFNTMNSNISEIKTEIKIRDEKYKDLYLTLTLENGKNTFGTTARNRGKGTQTSGTNFRKLRG